MIQELKISAEKFSQIDGLSDLKNGIEEKVGKEVTELIEIILGGAINLKASDIHIEPREDDVRLRLRIDGVLQDVALIPKQSYSPLLSRIKFSITR